MKLFNNIFPKTPNTWILDKPKPGLQAELDSNWENSLFIYSTTRLSRKNSPETSCGMTQTLGMTQNKIWAGFRI